MCRGESQVHFSQFSEKSDVFSNTIVVFSRKFMFFVENWGFSTKNMNFRLKTTILFEKTSDFSENCEKCACDSPPHILTWFHQLAWPQTIFRATRKFEIGNLVIFKGKEKQREKKKKTIFSKTKNGCNFLFRQVSCDLFGSEELRTPRELKSERKSKNLARSQNHRHF